MRVIPAVFLILAATISTASAQQRPSFSMDHGHAADAARAKEKAAAAARAKASAIANGRPLTNSQSTDFSINSGGTIRLAPLRTPEEQRADDEARSAWQERCRPTVVEDREGIRRTKYADTNCDISRFNTAGAQ